MTSKVNTKLVVFLIIAVVACTGIIGGLYYLNLRHNAARNARIGDEAFNAGNLVRALSYYGRAVQKDPGNMVYLEKIERTILRMQPTTAENARELYNNYLSVLAQAARFSSNEPERYLRLLDELTGWARNVNANRQWEAVIRTADEMLEQISATNPKRNLAHVYRSLAIFRLATQRTADEVNEALRNAQAVVDDMPDNDFAWATLIYGKMMLAQRMETENRLREDIAKQIQDIDQALEKATAAVPQGYDVARMRAIHLLQKMSNPEYKITAEEVQQAADRMVALTPDNVSSSYISEVADVLLHLPGDNLDQTIAYLKRWLSKHPDDLDKRYLLSRLHYARGQLDEAQDSARQVLAAPTLTTSFQSQLQPELRKRAAGVVADVAHRRWVTAPDADKPAHMKEMEDARAELLGLVTDRANDPNVLRADGKIAMSKGEYSKAAQCFEQLVKDLGAVDQVAGREVLLYSAYCLSQIGQIGLAHERISAAVRAAPDNPQFAVEKAKLELSMGRYDDATATLRALPQEWLDKPDVRALIVDINARAGKAMLAAGSNGNDPVLTVLANANAALLKGEFDSARASLLSGLQATPDEPRILEMLIYVEMNAGQKDKAREYLTKAQSLRPDDPSLQRVATLLRYDDPIEAIRELNKELGDNEVDRAVAMMLNLAAYGKSQEELANRLRREKDEAGADKAAAQAKRALSEARTYANQVATLAPDNIRLLEFQFNAAVDAKDWAAAEQMVSKARTLNADQADGALYRGRLELLRGNLQNAVRSLEAATDRLSFSALAWSLLGYAYELQSNSTQAQRAYDRAYKCNPNDLEIVRRYVKVLRQAGQQTTALDILRRVHQYAPQDKALRDAWLDLEAQIGDKALALNTRKQIYASDSKDRFNAFGLAKLLGEMEPTRELIVEPGSSVPISEQRWARLSTEERDQLIRRTRQDWYKLSDQILNELAASSGEELALASLRADLLRQRGQIVEGEQVLRRLIGKTDPASVTSAMLIELGKYQARTLHFKEAIDTLKEAIRVQDPQTREADMELALLYWTQLNRLDLALEHLRSVYEVQPNRGLQNQIIEVLTKLRRYDDAEAMLKKATTEQGDDFMLNLLAAGIAEGRGYELLSKGDAAGAERQFTLQREVLQRAETQESSNPLPRMLLAQSLLNEFQRTRRSALLDDALQALARAERLRPGATDISLLRVNIFKAKGERAAAIGELERHLERNPDDVQRRRELVDLYIDSQQVDKAIKVVDAAIKANPTISGWYEYKGDLNRLVRGDRSAIEAAAATALEAYTKAYELSPSPTLLLKITEASVATGKPDCRANADRLAARADDLASLPALREQYARALACTGDNEEAIKQARLAYTQRREMIKSGKDRPSDIGRWFAVLPALFPAGDRDAMEAVAQAEKFVIETISASGATPDVHELRALASLWLYASEPKLVHTLQYQRRAIDACPADQKSLKTDLSAELANYLLVSGNYPEAANVYEQILQLDSNNVTALNNLAYIISENMRDPKRALPYADKAMQLAPDDAAIIDTVGWIHVLAGQYEKARDLLELSLRKSPNPFAHLHLAELMVRTGKPEVARQHLDDAEKLGPDIETSQKIKSLRDDIQKGRTADR